MSKILKIAIVVIILAFACNKYLDYPRAWFVETFESDGRHSATSKDGFETGKSSAHYSCDGRKRCSQMTSCEEATFFLNHCPETEMDGDGDGVPCEKQWCN